MEIPDCVKIGGVPYEVYISEDKHDLLELTYCGRIDYGAQRIALRKCGPDAMKISLLHECLHGMLNALGLCSDKHDEQLIDGLAHQLLLLLRDNPEMLRETSSEGGYTEIC